ncbi:hypothetical protein B0J18DRAFT_272803 [Chaetomium sp. MPI-SDFR-AT-0129]|nr:hypothetical protein B0J18DRAFT_272803 [Chaetomium sp. MPI-SDFR-AT-0129]
MHPLALELPRSLDPLHLVGQPFRIRWKQPDDPAIHYSVVLQAASTYPPFCVVNFRPRATRFTTTAGYSFIVLFPNNCTIAPPHNNHRNPSRRIPLPLGSSHPFRFGPLDTKPCACTQPIKLGSPGLSSTTSTTATPQHPSSPAHRCCSSRNIALPAVSVYSFSRPSRFQSLPPQRRGNHSLLHGRPHYFPPPRIPGQYRHRDDSEERALLRPPLGLSKPTNSTHFLTFRSLFVPSSLRS